MSAILGGGLPDIKLPESNTQMNNLPEGFKEWCFDRNTGELIPEELLNKPRSQFTTEEKKMDVFAVTSRTEENARKEFKRLAKMTLKNKPR